jgi:hypothetical protein
MMGLILNLVILSKILDFSGFKWRTFDNYDDISKNYFSGELVILRGDTLVLKCHAEPKDTTFILRSAGVISLNTYSYGTFIFDVKGDLSNLISACFAPFLYDFSRGEFEVDIEFSRWGNPGNPVGNYGVIRQFGKWKSPDSVKRAGEKFNLPSLKSSEITRHYIRWYPDSLIFETYLIKKGAEKLIKRWSLKEKSLIPNKPVNVEIYLWWPAKPRREKMHEIKVLRFSYIPYNSLIHKDSLPGAPKVPEVGK